MSVELSVIIPAFNRADLLAYTLKSVNAARGKVALEVLVVDDGSSTPMESQLPCIEGLPLRCIRQSNQGSIVARMRGLQEARGEFVVFLDSDDLVHSEKFTKQLEAMRRSALDVSYTDIGSVRLEGDFEALESLPDREVAEVSDPVEFYLALQLVPHAPMYRREYLKRHLTTPLISPARQFDCVGDVWIYYNLAPYPAKVGKVPGYLTLIGMHDQDRFTRHWERLGVASLALMLAFVNACPDSPETLEARTRVGECAMISWRKLPLGFQPVFEEQMLNIWKRMPKGPVERLGGRYFQLLGGLLGVECAARILRCCQRPRYSAIRTIPQSELESLVANLSKA